MTSDQTIIALEEQLGFYRRLAKLAELQHEHVQQSSTEGLMKVLTQRQEVLDEISRCEQTVGPIRRQWSDYAATLNVDQRQLAESMLAEIRMLLEQITTADRNDALILQQRKLSLGRELNQANAVRQVNRAYATAAYGKRDPKMDVQR